MSPSERAALAHFATLPMHVIGSQSFTPLLSKHYRDGAGAELWGKPDAFCRQPRSFTYIESKNGILNDHRSKASCHRALQQEFERTTHDTRPKEYNDLTKHFRQANYPFLMANSWNCSLYKVLAIQRLHGFEKYIVVFAKNQQARDAKRYADAGLVFATHANVAQLLAVIELAANGIYIPFRLDAHKSGYIVTVEPSPNPAHLGLTPEQIAADNRACFEEVVATATAAEAALAAAEAAEREAEIVAYHADKAARAAALAAAPEARVLPAGVTPRSRSRK